MGTIATGILSQIFSGIEPYFDFMVNLWSALPLPFRYVFSLLFGVAIVFVILKNVIL